MERVDIERFKLIVGHENVKSDRASLELYSYDATRRHYLPECVVRPNSAEEIAEIMNVAYERTIPVYPRGAATGMSGGALPVKGGVALDLARMNRILEINTTDHTALVEPGVVNAELQKAVGRLGLFYPPDPASNEFSTIGGNVAENAGGLRAVKYGVTRDYVLALEAVLPSGEIIHTGAKTLKSVTGYDLTGLLVGSEGTLAIFTKILLKLIPKPPEARAALCGFDSAAKAVEAVNAIVNANVLPRAMEFIDNASLRAVDSYKPMTIKGQAITPDAVNALLLIEVDGRESACEAEMGAVLEACKKLSPMFMLRSETDSEREELWSVRKSISPALYKLKPIKFNEDICVPRSRMVECLEMATAIGLKYDLLVACFGHAGDGNIHVDFMIDEANSLEAESVHKALRELMEGVVRLGGTLSGEHGIGITKAEFLDLEIPPVEKELMKQIKAVFDPKNVLNPGKIFSAEAK